MTDLIDLYQEVLLDHNRSPRNFRKIEGANRMAKGYNPLCGDEVTVYLDLKDEVIQDISFQGSGCAISKASASIMTTVLKGKVKKEIEALFEAVHKMLTGQANQGMNASMPEKLQALSGVSRFPVRVKCASLAWHTLRAALEGKGETVTTE
jgi:nitrogen fixation NifU-like protein